MAVKLIGTNYKGKTAPKGQVYVSKNGTTLLRPSNNWNPEAKSSAPVAAPKATAPTPTTQKAAPAPVAAPAASANIQTIGTTYNGKAAPSGQTYIRKDGVVLLRPLSNPTPELQGGGSSSAAPSAPKIDPSYGGLEYIGGSYTSSSGAVRTAKPGNAYYQDPNTRTIVERPDQGQGNSKQSTSPSVLASRNPQQMNQSEVERINAEANDLQGSELATINAATSGKVDVSKSMDLITRALADKPQSVSLAQTYADQKAATGVDADSAALAQKEADIAALKTEWASEQDVETSRPGTTTIQINRRLSAKEINFNKQLAGLTDERNFLANQVNQKLSIVNTMVSLIGQDYANAQKEYQDRFTNAITVMNLVRSIHQDELTAQQRAQDNARANVQVYAGLIKEGNLKYSSLSASAKADLKEMEIQAGFQPGFTSFITQATKDPIVTFPGSYTDDSGYRIQPVITTNPTTGKFYITNVKGAYVGKDSTGTGAGKPTESQLVTAAKSIAGNSLSSMVGGDGKVSPNDWNNARQQWIQNTPYSAKDFDANFSRYINKNDPNWEENYDNSFE